MRVIYAPEVLFTNESTKLVADIPEYQWIDLTRFDVLENQVNENFFSSQLLQVFAKFLRVWKSCCCCEELRNSSVLALCIQTFFSRGFSESLLIWKIRHGSLSSAKLGKTAVAKSEMQFYQDFSGFCEKVENGLLIVS